MVEDDLRSRVEQLESELAELKAMWLRHENVAASSPSGPVRTDVPVVTRGPDEEPPDALTWPQAPPKPAPIDGPFPTTFLTAPRQPVTESRPAEEPPSPDDGDVEFRIGGRYMTVAGAVVVVIGIVYLVALAVSNGWITPTVQFAGELLLCAAFVGVGLWKIDERENFGQLLVGVGACGSFLSFAGAYATKHLITSQTLVVAFIGVSLGCLGLSLWRSSKAFFSLGLLGGFLAVLLPLRDGGFAAAQSLHPILLVPCAGIVWKRKWTWLAYALFGVSLMATVAILAVAAENGAPLWASLFLFDVFGLTATAAYAGARREDEEGKIPLLGYAASTVIGLIPFAIFPALATPAGYGATVLLSGAFFALGKWQRDPAVTRALTTGAIVTGAVVAPFALTPVQACAVFAAEAVAASLLARKGRTEAPDRWSVAFCLIGAGASVWSAIPTLTGTAMVSWSTASIDAASLSVLALCAAFATTRSVASGSAPENQVSLALLAAGLAARVPFLIGVRSGLSPAAACEAGVLLALWSSVLAIIRFRTLVPALSVTVFQAVFVALSLGLTFPPAAPRILQFSFMTASVGALVVAVVAIGRVKADGLSSVAVLASLGAMVPFCWAGHIAMASAGVAPMTAVVVSLSVFAALMAWTARARNWNDLAWASVAYASIGVAPYVLFIDASSSSSETWTRGGDITAAASLMFAAVCSGAAMARAMRDRAGLVMAVTSVPVGLLTCRIGYLALTAPGVGVQNVLAVLMTASAVAAALALGSIAKRYAEVAWVAVAFLAFGVALYPAMKIPELGLVAPATRLVTRTADMAAVGTLFMTCLVVGRALWAASVEPRVVLTLLVPLEWALSAGFLMLWLTGAPFGLKFDASLSLAWIVYGAALIATGFWRTERLLRYWGLAVFGSTLVKVVFYDLAYLEVNIKVVVLIGFGIVMLTASHAYIRAKKNHRLGS